MPTTSDAINQQYGRPRLTTHILRAFEAMGKDLDRLTLDDLAPVGEFHIRGREATRELARLANLQPGEQVLDVGCGIGGPARTLAAEFGSEVTGLDLTEAYCRTARMLTERVGMKDQVEFVQGNAVDLPFDDARFDVVWMQHTSMNIADKAQLFAEIHRVLRPGGRLALYEIGAGPGGEPHFPVPWADDDTLNFLMPPDTMRQELRVAGFDVQTWHDVTAPCLHWFRDLLTSLADRPPTADPPLGLNLLMGNSTGEKLRNVVRNLEEARIVVVQGIAEHTGE
jgi:ubiquinone/menaquinone biosynthesis C-methylase UbiE